MARHRKHEEHENHERWLVSYADFITLLFAFFVVMFASSQADAKKAAAVSESIREAYQGQPHTVGVISRVLGRSKDPSQTKNPGDFSKLRDPSDKENKPPEDPTPPTLDGTYSLLKTELAKEIEAGKIQMKVDSRGLVISLSAGAFFPSGEDRIAPEMYEPIRKIAQAIARMKNPVRMEGHTDAVPLRRSGRFPSNWHLSAARAVAMLDLFRTEFGVSSDRLAVVGYAETKPIDTNETPEGRARNRRVDVVLLNDTASAGEPKAVAEKPAPAAARAADPGPFWRRWLHL